MSPSKWRKGGSERKVRTLAHHAGAPGKPDKRRTETPVFFSSRGELLMVELVSTERLHDRRQDGRYDSIRTMLIDEWELAYRDSAAAEF
jgi:hypothetical protein